MQKTDPASYLPLREPTFFILLSLIPAEKHGYGILKDVETLSEGSVRLSTGTLYEALSRLLEQGLLERTDEAVGVAPGKPRKVYRLTHTGRRVIEAEAARLRALTAAAKRQMGDAKNAWNSNNR
jgi:DNA-binding PadR family transcriptional regulator